MTKVLFSNIGYARGIDGTLWQHFCRFNRHIYCRIPLQNQVLSQLQGIIRAEDPDLCCFVEIDQGSLQSAYLNQMQHLLTDRFAFHDVAEKYGQDNWIGKLPMHKGKSNGFVAKRPLDFRRLYFNHGSKRLLYSIALNETTDVLFGHFSLQYKVRRKQFEEVAAIIRETGKNVIILADFNIMLGFSELTPLLESVDLALVSKEEEPTFRFHRRKLALDLCLCSKTLLPYVNVKVIPQPFSDHAALLVEIKSSS